MSAAESSRSKYGLTVLLGVMWLQLYWSLIPSWDPEGYYSYGWMVAPAAFLFAWRRISILRGSGQEVPPQRTAVPLVAGFTVFLLLIPLLRIVEVSDPSWRLPLFFHVILLVGLSHFAVAWKFGWKCSVYFMPVTIFALSAVPYPWQIEQKLIRTLTGGVIHISAEFFNLAGRPVAVVGEKLESMGTVVEVTEGCSGIRSFQNLVMAALFFGELFRLHWFSRVMLVVVGIVASVVMNTGRAMTLARIRFDKGEEAFEAAHDNVGYLAFFISAAVLLAVAKFLSEARVKRRRVVRTSTVAP